MLVVALVLLVAAAGLLVASMLTGQLLWAWVSAGVSGLAAVAMGVRSWRRWRSRGRHSQPAGEGTTTADTGTAAVADPTRGTAASASGPDERDEPGEEDTDAADLLVVSELADEVLVVDEHPRYHLRRCSWLTSRPAEPLPVAEARELGFTPCARCGPDVELAGRHRATSTS